MADRKRAPRDTKVERITEDLAIKFMHDALVHNRIHFGYEWQGWRMAGRDLVTPEGDRINASQLLGLVRRQAWQERLYKGVQAPADRVIEFPVERLAARA